MSGEVRARLPIGNKFSISAGIIYRTHQKAYGYNPIEIWLNETEVIEGEEFPVNPWYSLGYEYGLEIYLTCQTFTILTEPHLKYLITYGLTVKAI